MTKFKPIFIQLGEIAKTRISLILVICCLFSINVNATSILLLGDSLSASRGMQQKEGWVHLLNQQFSQQKSPLKIINASISGETTGGGLARLSLILSKNEIDYLLIELGGNDGLRGFPPALIKNNLLQIIKLAQAKGTKVMLMDIRIPPNYGARYTKLFNNTFSKVAQETKVTLLPFFIEKIALQPTLMQSDGIHPNKTAQPMIAATMKKQLENIILNK
ncbi:MAG: arylesterase [Gammaproteobacteria bacterium]|nr:MAG: arylesterase [Gammaproteobacteria bacterium]